MNLSEAPFPVTPIFCAYCPDIIAARMLKSWDEISRWSEYEYVLINDQLDQTEERLRAIVAAERLRRSQQPGLLSHVRRLQAEFEEMR